RSGHSLSSALLVAWAKSGPGSEVPRRWKSAHVHANLGQDRRGGNRSDPRDGLQQGEGFLERRETALDLNLHLSDCLLEEIDVREDLVDQDKVMRLQPSGESLA